MINSGGGAGDYKSMPIARYQVEYHYHPIFFPFPGFWANNFLNREVIFVGNMNVRNLWTNRQAAVSVEFVAISIVLFIFIFFLSDLVLRQAMIGKLDRVSYSVSGVLRERIQLFDAREELNQQDVDLTLIWQRKCCRIWSKMPI